MSAGKAIPHAAGRVAAEHGVAGPTRAPGIECARDNIRVNAVCPGRIATDMTRDTVSGHGDGDKVLAAVPARGLGEAREVADSVRSPASARAGYVTGATCKVDGGYPAR